MAKPGHDAPALSFADARARMLAAVAPVGDTETLPLEDGLHRVLAVPIHAGVNVPGHDNSAMDGYALRAEDAQNEETRLRLIGDSFAGCPFAGEVGAGECVRIMTGAVIPAGSTAVVMQERTQVAGEYVTVSGPVKNADNVRPAGEDFAKDAEVLPAGRRLTAWDLGVLASVGAAHIKVWRRPRVAFFSTGDELRGVGEALAPGDIYDSNRYSLLGLLQKAHCEYLDLGLIPDSPESVESALREAAGQADAIITTGGVSVGAADYVVDVLERIGQVDFWRVEVKPGRPFAFGRIGAALFFGLPGNPVSAVVSFMQYLRPALDKLAGGPAVPPLQFPARCTRAIRKKPGRLEFQRGRLCSEAGLLSVEPFGHQGSGVLRSMSRADCFIVLSAEQADIQAGDSVMVEPFLQSL